jgi:translation initiation factor 1A
MVKNKGGNKTKRVARKQLHGELQKRTLNELMKTEGQEYAVVRKINGGGRFGLICADKIERIGVVRPTLKRNKKFIEVNQLILVSLRDFQENTCDILDIYTGSEVEYLVSSKLIDREFIKQHMGQKDIDGNVVDEEISGFTIKHRRDEDSDSDDKEDDKKGVTKKSSIDDIWDEI